MMYNGANSNGKRKLEQSIVNESPSSPPTEVTIANTPKHNTAKSKVTKPRKKKQRTDDTTPPNSCPSPSTSPPPPTTTELTTLDTSHEEVEVPSTIPTAEAMLHPMQLDLLSNNNPIVQSAQAEFLKQKVQQSNNESAHRVMESMHSSPPSSPTSITTTTTTANPANSSPPQSTMKVTNVYRGLYPIKNVKQHFKKNTVNNQKLYICQWPECNFQTWKYSQHISRHIYLKHIGIKELRCQVSNCDKVFKRPESLVQHVKNHICGFGIDPVRMKDPNNTCGVKNIKRHFSKIMDNDIQVFKCQFDRCTFVTNNSGSIRRHVHNQHICPHSSPAANATNGSSGGHTVPVAPTQHRRSSSSHSSSTDHYPTTADSNSSLRSGSSPYQFGAASNSSSASSSAATSSPEEDQSSSPAFDPLVVLTEYEDQTYDPVNRSINHQNNHDSDDAAAADDDADSITDMPMDFTVPRLSATLNRLDDDDDEEEDDNEGAQDNDGGARPLMNGHQQSSLGNGAFLPLGLTNTLAQQQVAFATLAGLPSTSAGLGSFLHHQLSAAKSAVNSQAIGQGAESDSVADRRKNNGLYSLKNYKEYYYKTRTAEHGVQFICKGCGFQAKSQITLIRHLWNELGYKEFHCEFEGCSRTFDNEFSRYKHRKFDHGQQQSQQHNQGPVDSGSLVESDRFSPSIPPLVPMPTTTTSASMVGSSYNSLTNTLFGMGQQRSSMVLPIITTGSALHVSPSTVVSAPSTTTTFVPHSNRFGVVAPPTSMVPPLVDRVMPPVLPITSTERRQSSASETGPVNSSLISILTAPSVAATAATTTNNGTPQSSNSFLSLPTISELSFPNPLNHSTPVLSTAADATVSKPPSSRSTAASLSRHFSGQFERIPNPGTGSNDLFKCNLCDFIGGSQTAILKHLRAHRHNHSSPPVSSSSAGVAVDTNRSVTPTPSVTAVVSSLPSARPRASSTLSAGAMSAGGDGAELEMDEDEEISVEDDEAAMSNVLNGEMFASSLEGIAGSSNAGDKATQAAIRKYNCRSKSGLYSLKKHEQDYVRTKGLDGYHYQCVNCDEYTTKSQASMVRHIWTHKKQNFRCDCGLSFENEFSLYKHKKTTHPELTSQHNRCSSKSNAANANNANKTVVGSKAHKDATSTATNAVSGSSALLAGVGGGVGGDGAVPPVVDSGLFTSLDSNPNSTTAATTAEQQMQMLQLFQLQQMLAMHHLQQQQQQSGTAQAVTNPDWQQMALMARMYQEALQNAASTTTSAGGATVATSPTLTTTTATTTANGSVLESHNEPEHDRDDSESDLEHLEFRSPSPSSSTTSEPTTEDTDGRSHSAEQKGMSRRALRFKSHQNKPVHIKPQEDEEE